MKATILLTAFIAVIAIALLALQEVRFQRHLQALQAERAAALAAAAAKPDSSAELAEAVRQMSQARSELATAQNRLNAALQQISALQTQLQSAIRPAQVLMEPRRLGPRLVDLSEPTGLPPQGLRRSWGEEQATGAPDTDRAGDVPTAWASRMPDGGEEWLNLEYSNVVQLAEVRVRETYNPGAISKVVAILPNGQEQVIWEGVTDPTEAPVDTVFPVTGNVTAKSVKVYLDTKRVPGWNEIDAVEIVGRDGARQWASHATASSSFADQR